MLVPPPPFSYVTSFMNVPQNLQIFFFHRESHLYVFKILNLKVVFYFPNPFDLILFCYLCINQFQKVFLCNKLLNNDRLHLIKNHVWGVFPRTGKLPGSVFPNQGMLEILQGVLKVSENPSLVLHSDSHLFF